MAYTVLKSDDVWITTMEDHPGALAEKLDAIAEAGGDLEFVLARRMPDHPGKGILFAAPIKGAKASSAAKKAGFHKTPDIKTVRLEGRDKPGLVAAVTGALGEAGINLRGLSAMKIGAKCVVSFAVDKAPDATKAVKVIRTLLKIK